MEVRKKFGGRANSNPTTTTDKSVPDVGGEVGVRGGAGDIVSLALFTIALSPTRLSKSKIAKI